MKIPAVSERTIYFCIAAASILYFLLIPRFHVGTYNDDGAYVLAAHSLLKGKYVQLNLPQQPPFTLYPPGFPFLLAPFALIVGSNLALLKGVPFLLTLLSLFLLWKLTKGWLSLFTRLLLIGFYALNPITTAFSGLIMSESFFVAASLGLLLRMRHHPKEFSSRASWIMGLLLGWAALIRTDGIALLLAIAFLFVCRRQWKSMRIIIPTATALCGLFYLRNSLVAGASTVYQAGWGLMFEEIQRQGWQFPLKHAYNVLATLVLQNFISPLISIPSIPFFLVISLLVFGGGLILLGFRALLKEHPQDSPLFFAMACFCGLYLGVHLLWLGIETRYGMPLVPFLGIALFKGAEYSAARFPILRKVGSLVFGIIGLGYIAQNALAIHTTRTLQDPTYSPETYRWMVQSLPRESLTLASGAAVVYLYTGRFITLEAAARDAEHFRYELLRQGIRYVLLRPLDYYHSPLTAQDPNRVWGLRRLWLQQNPKLYRSVYQNANERTEIFELQANPAFVASYEQYLSALSAFDRADWDKGFMLLERVLMNNPNLISAYNAYGVGSLLSGKKTDAALRKLRQGHRRAPNNALLLLNLAKLEQRAGEYAAREHFQKAREVAEKTGEYPAVLRALEQDSPL